jgi:hypothetical protein
VLLWGNKKEMNEKREARYNSRLEKLREFEKNNYIQWKKADMKDFRIVIVKYKKEERLLGKLLIITHAGGNYSEKCGLFSEEYYLVSLASNTFDDLFDNV